MKTMFEALTTIALVNNDITTYAAFKNLETKGEDVKNEDTKKKKIAEKTTEEPTPVDLYTKKALRTIREMYE